MTTPILTAALARQSRRNPHGAEGGGGKKKPNNYIAEGRKRPVGAPLGNRNAARRSREDVDRLARLDALIRQSETLAGITVATVRDTAARRETLLALLAEPRHD